MAKTFSLYFAGAAGLVVDMSDIKFVQQPTPDSCTSACLAMLTGISVDTVIGEFHHKWKSSATNCNPMTYLADNDFDCLVNHDPFNHRVKWGSVYLVTVSSLNIEGGLHHIVLDMRGNEEIVLDPNMGRSGKKYYTGWTQKSESTLAVQLSSWMVDLEFFPSKNYGGEK